MPPNIFNMLALPITRATNFNQCTIITPKEPLQNLKNDSHGLA
jgi:hypothetical protein